LRNGNVPSSADDWRPTTSPSILRRRARILATIRSFFADRGVLEVETPLLSAAAATAPHIQSFKTECPSMPGQYLYLQTSPEPAMKRLLAAGSGPIFQICKAFRVGEQGPLHNPEFTILEWYRPAFSTHALMDEAEALLERVLPIAPVRRLPYREAFRNYAEIDPFAASTPSLREYATRALGIAPQTAMALERDVCLDLILSHRVQPALRQRATWLYEFPASQAQLARIREGDSPVAERFELFVAGVELANGYCELTNSEEQAQRFLGDLTARRRLGLPPVPIDSRLLRALEHGIGECSGIAVGFDRLVMLSGRELHLKAVMPFPISRA
jgi:lysyl-tRNA synthetase class 2